MKKLILTIILLCIGLSACDLEEKCTESQHQECHTVLIPMLVGKVMILTPITNCECKENK